jgi:hypothetical protein
MANDHIHYRNSDDGVQVVHDEDDLFKIRRCICKADGTPLFTDEHLKVLGDKAAVIFAGALDRIDALSAGTPQSKKTIEKNSKPTREGD